MEVVFVCYFSQKQLWCNFRNRETKKLSVAVLKREKTTFNSQKTRDVQKFLMAFRRFNQWKCEIIEKSF